jgi:nucleoside phosphorylase
VSDLTPGEDGGRPGAVVILAPMRSELRPVLKALTARRASVGDVPAHRGRAGRREVVVGLIGVGPAAARAATDRLLTALDDHGTAVAHVVVSGIAGGIAEDLEVGDMVVPAAVMDLASGRSYRAAPVPGHANARTVATVGELILDPARLATMAADGIDVLDMETAAVAEVAESRQIPWSAVRVISDRPRDGLLDEGIMTMLRPDGSVDPLAALKHIATHPSRLPKLARLGRDAGAAATRAGRTAVAVAGSL